MTNMHLLFQNMTLSTIKFLKFHDMLAYIKWTHVLTKLVRKVECPHYEYSIHFNIDTQIM